MRTATVFLGICLSFAVIPMLSSAQTVDYSFTVPNAGTDLTLPYPPGHSGARGVTGPFDSDGDGAMELLLTDYASGGRVYVIENAGIDTWELVYSVPFQDSTGASNARYALGDIDLDGDGNKEIAFLSGNSFSATNPRVVDGTYRPGLFVYEHTGADNDYGTLPAFVCEFEQFGAHVAEQFAIQDVDGDGKQEILVPNNGPSTEDHYFIYSVSDTFEPDGAASTFATCNDEYTLVRGGAVPGEGFDFTFLGNGSPYAIHPADLDGDGAMELSVHSYNFFNFFNVDVTGADAYAAPDTSQADAYLQATAPDDHVSLFGGTVVDINGDGDDEVFYPRFQSGADGLVSLLNYESGEDVLKITTDNFLLDFLGPLTQFGIVAGDVTGDGNPDLIGAGTSYTGTQYDSAEPSSWIKVAAWVGAIGADPEDVSNYDIRTFDTSSPIDTTHLNTVYRDSAGTLSVYHESATGKFPTKVAYLGDADGDGAPEIAVAFQSVADSVDVIDEVWNADATRYDRTIRERLGVDNREFVRILSAQDYNVAIENTRIITPDDYVLQANYPNPFRGETTIGFELPLDKRISVRVYDITGRLVSTIVDDEQYTRGAHSVTWDGKTAAGADVASGTYFYTLEYGNFRKSRQMVVVK